MKGSTLKATVERYNSFVDGEERQGFGKPSPKYKIQTPPFYAAWGTPVVHDTRAGLRINVRCQVIDMSGKVIPGLYCAGESAGGFNQHGMGRCATRDSSPVRTQRSWRGMSKGARPWLSLRRRR